MKRLGKEKENPPAGRREGDYFNNNTLGHRAFPNNIHLYPEYTVFLMEYIFLR